MSASANTPIEVTRNNVTVTFNPTDFARGAKKEAGIKYPGFPEVTAETLDTIREFLGEDNFFGIVNEQLRLWAQGTYNSSVVKDSFDENLFKNFMTELSTRGESREEIESALKTLNESLFAVMAKAQGTEDVGAKLAALTEFSGITDKIRKYNNILESRKRGPRKAKDADTDNESNSAPVAA